MAGVALLTDITLIESTTIYIILFIAYKIIY